MPRVWKFGDNIDTDQIVPGRYSPYMTAEEELTSYAFIEHRPEFASKVQPGDIIVAGLNFGCGSSREYAPRALKRCGIAAIIASSFARIFFRNALNLGLPVFEDPYISKTLADGEEIRLDVTSGELHTDERVFVLSRQPRFVYDILREGSVVEYYRKHGRFPGLSER
jgi:methanogen homoaconitase small subunit